MSKIDYSKEGTLRTNSATKSEIETYFNDYDENTIPDEGSLNFSDVNAGKTGTEPYEIINSILVFDKDDSRDPYFTGDYADSDWSTTLRYVTDDDLRAYATKNNVDYDNVKAFVTEVREADLNGRDREDGVVESKVATKSEVLDAFSNDNDKIMNYVTEFDNNDQVGVNRVTAADLNKFAEYYGLNDEQIAKLVELYPDIATFTRRGNKNADDEKRDKIVAI